MNWAWAAEQAEASSGGGHWQLALVVAGIVLLGVVARRRGARPPPPRAADIRARVENAEKHRDAADRAMVDLVETGREISAQIDTKIRLLNRLVKDADDRIARLERLGRTEPPAADAVPEGRPLSPPAPPDASGTGSGRYRSALQARVAGLAREGRSHSEISRATGLSLVEVQLAVGHGEQQAE